MGHEEETTNLFLSNLVINKKSKGNLYVEKPIFHENGKQLIVSSGRSLQLYDTATGNHIKELFQCADDIISYQSDPTDSNLLIAVTGNGELVVYNTKADEIKYSIKLQLNPRLLNVQKAPKYNSKNAIKQEFNWDTQPLDSLAHRKFLYARVKPCQSNPAEMIVWTSWCLNDEKFAHLSAFTFSKGKHIRIIYLKEGALSKRHMNFVLGAVQGCDIFVGMSNSNVHILRYDMKKQPFYIKHNIGSSIKFSCLAFHPTECCFASGDSMGRIIIWRNIFEKPPFKEVLHWHALPVHDLFFTDYGSYLFSGGEENVLVKWSLNTNSKQFLPRLSSAIHHISGSCESSLLSISTMDNKIQIINFNFQNISTVQHFSRWSLLKRENRLSVFTVDLRSNCFVLNGKTGHIQFLSLNEDGKFIYTFDVTNRNFITSDSECTIRNTEVTHAKFSKSGKWLITVESRKEDTCKESRLKFWSFHEKRDSFTLSTNVEFPHEDFEIFTLEISSDDVVATTGGDKKFRLWSIFEYEENSKTKEFWSTLAVNKYRDLPCHDVDFSKDASLVGVTFGPILTIWETGTPTLKCTLSVPTRKDDLKFCKFGNNEMSHLIVGGSAFRISSWNVITLSVIWTVHLQLSLLISDPFSIYLVAFLSDRSLVIFNPASPTPDLTLKNIADSPVAGAHCVPNERGKFCLYFVTENQELFCLEDVEKVTGNVSSNAPQSAFTSYSAQLAEIQNKGDFDKKKSSYVIQNNKQLVSSFLNSPAHTLPNPSLLCLDFLKGLLLFSKSQSSGVVSVMEAKNNDAVETDKIPAGCANIDSEKGESELLDIVKAIFVQTS